MLLLYNFVNNQSGFYSHKLMLRATQPLTYPLNRLIDKIVLAWIVTKRDGNMKLTRQTDTDTYIYFRIAIVSTSN